MKHLTYTAAREMLAAIRLSQFAGLATWTETLDRLIALCQMCSPRNPSRQASERILKLEEWSSEGEWPQEGDENGADVRTQRTATTLRTSAGEVSDENDEPDYLYLYPGSHTGLAQWEFRPYDADPYPSVPHGHWLGRSKPKLDAYQGWVYEGTRQVRREPRKKMISLWNDRAFREFALGSIRFYMKHYPQHGDWRPVNPLRLPRRR
jgi:hypothetical protein